MCIPMAKRLTVGAQFRRGFSCLTHGHFAQFITRSDLPKFAAGTADKGTPDENKAVLSGFVASFGTYTVDEADKTVITNVEGSVFPNSLGQEHLLKNSVHLI
jgi:hypothetical protein